MRERDPISISYCEKCGTKVSSRDELCSKCGTLPFQDDRYYSDEIKDELYPNIDYLNEEQSKKYEEWYLEKFDEWYETNQRNYCKDCGKRMEDLIEYNDDYVNEVTGEVVTTNDHPCNPNPPIYP